MTHNDEDILLNDLCARLPYGVKFAIGKKYLTEDMIKGGYYKTQELYGITREGNVELLNMDYHMPIESIKPYLFPLSSMTDEQIYQSPFGYATMDTIRQDDIWSAITIGCKEYDDIVDWLNKNHFDYRGLIEKGLAIDATELNIY